MRTVTVTGSGEARVAPDSAVARVSASHVAEGVAEALAGADSAARAVAATAREHTAAERIASSGLSVWTHHDRDGDVSGFQAQHTLTIGCADLATAGAMLTALADEVGNRLTIDGVSLEVADHTAALRAAREAAYADAVERATQLAGLAGAELGDPQDVVEGGGMGVPVARQAEAMSAAVSFQPGETAIGASVTVTFQLR